MKKIKYLIIIALLTSCTNEWEVEPRPQAERTLLVYLGGDNNLSSEVQDKTKALLKGWQSRLGNLLIFADTQGGKTVLVQAKQQNGKKYADTIRRYTNLNSASSELLKEVLADTRRLAPAPSYGMVLFSHATGWLPAKSFENPTTWTPPISTRSIFVDKEKEMEFSDFVSAIPDNMFEFMAFDMCFMSSVETSYALRKKTKYVVGSVAEILSPGFTPLYEKHLSMLYESKPNLTGFAQAFYDYYNSLEGVYRAGGISIVRTSEMEALAQLTKALSPQPTVAQIDKMQYYDRKGKPHLFFDFGSYMQESLTAEQYAKVEKQLQKIVLFKRHTSRLINIDINTHSGLAVYIPQAETPSLNAQYETLEWTRAVSR